MEESDAAAEYRTRRLTQPDPRVPATRTVAAEAAIEKGKAHRAYLESRGLADDESAQRDFEVAYGRGSIHDDSASDDVILVRHDVGAD